MLGALNATLGDYLRARKNGLAFDMGIVHDGRVVKIDAATLSAMMPSPNADVVVFVHGLGCTESVWEYPDDDTTTYGSQLARDFGVSTYAVRYNTGLHVSENGEALADTLERLLRHHPVPVRRLALVGHSMGGLVIRSACHAGTERAHAWVAKLDSAFYLGSPHLGAPLEKFANVLSLVLGKVPTETTRLLSSILEVRSAGVKDLRHANLVRADWDGKDPRAIENLRTLVPLLEHVRHHVVVGTISADEKDLLAVLFGDAMVRVASAAGRAGVTDKSPQFPQEHVRVVPNVAHLTLTHHPSVYDVLRTWFAERFGESTP